MPTSPKACAVVSYLSGPLAAWLEPVRRELDPAQSHLPPHLTLLPPRPVAGEGRVAQGAVQAACREMKPFEFEVAGLTTFLPATPTLIFSIEKGARHVRFLHGLLGRGALAGEEQWPFIPHLTLAVCADAAATQRALELVRPRWASYHGPRRHRIETLTLVCEASQPGHWDDIAAFDLA